MFLSRLISALRWAPHVDAEVHEVEAIDSFPMGNRFHIDVASDDDSPSIPNRFRIDVEDAPQRSFQPRRSPGTTPEGEVYIDRHSMLDRFLNGPSALEHAEHVLRCFHHSCFQPGDVVETHDMQQIYRHICREVGWRPLKWGGPEGVGKHLRRLFNGPDKPENYKPYRELPDEDGVRKRARVFIVPERAVSARVAQPDHAEPDRRLAA
jgi:hypothetical protein